MSNTGYGWYLRHSRSGAFVKIDDADGSRCSTTFDPRDADQFATREQALDILGYLNEGTSTFPRCDVVDATIPSPVPDAEPLKLKSFEEVLAEARAKSAAERAARAHQGGGSDLLDTPPPPPQPNDAPLGPSKYGAGGFGSPNPLFSGRRRQSQEAQPRPESSTGS